MRSTLILILLRVGSGAGFDPASSVDPWEPVGATMSFMVARSGSSGPETVPHEACSHSFLGGIPCVPTGVQATEQGNQRLWEPVGSFTLTGGGNIPCVPTGAQATASELERCLSGRDAVVRTRQVGFPAPSQVNSSQGPVPESQGMGPLPVRESGGGKVTQASRKMKTLFRRLGGPRNVTVLSSLAFLSILVVMVAQGRSGDANRRVPPRWGPEMEHIYNHSGCTRKTCCCGSSQPIYSPTNRLQASFSDSPEWLKRSRD